MNLTIAAIRAISHFLWFQEGRAEEEEFQEGSSVQWGKGWHGDLKSLWGSNILQHKALPVHLDQSGYSKSQPYKAGGRQSPRDNRNLKNSHRKSIAEINQLQQDQKSNQEDYCFYAHTPSRDRGFSQTLNFFFPHCYFLLLIFTVNPPDFFSVSAGCNYFAARI